VSVDPPVQVDPPIQIVWPITCDSSECFIPAGYTSDQLISDMPHLLSGTTLYLGSTDLLIDGNWSGSNQALHVVTEASNTYWL